MTQGTSRQVEQFVGGDFEALNGITDFTVRGVGTVTLGDLQGNFGQRSNWLTLTHNGHERVIASADIIDPPRV